MKKVLLSVLALILIAGIVCVGYHVNEKKKIANYSTLCFDKAREQVGEYLGNVASFFQMKDDGNYFYYGSFSYEEVDYKYYCKVQDKDNVNLKLEVVSEEPTYNENSWKEMIDDDCMLFFDGCNDCSKDSDGTITCTTQECETYQKPVCTDDSGIVPEEAVHNEVIYDDYNQFLEDIKSSGEQPQGKKMIDDCNRYFDGCNRCTKQDDGERICTEEACKKYQEAYCADEQYDEFLEMIKSSNKSELYHNVQYGIQLGLSEELNGGKIIEEDSDDMFPHHKIIFLAKDDTATADETGIDGYREKFTVWVVPVEYYEDAMIGFTEDNILGKNNKYYFFETKPDPLDTNYYYMNTFVENVK